MEGSRVQGPAAGPGRSWPLVGAVALLAAANLLNNVVAPGFYLLWTSLGVIGLALLARADGLSPRQWGLGRVSRRAGVAALALAALTVTGLVVGTHLPGVSSAFIDDRVSGTSAGRIAFDALVRAPFGTALFEETAFRGVLLAMLARRFGSVWAVTGSSLAFGAWHVVPALGVVAGNAAVDAALGSHPGWAAAAGVIASALAGGFLCLLRIRYDHLIVPITAHATANSLSYFLAWLMTGS